MTVEKDMGAAVCFSGPMEEIEEWYRIITAGARMMSEKVTVKELTIDTTGNVGNLSRLAGLQDEPKIEIFGVPKFNLLCSSASFNPEIILQPCKIDVWS
jgi:hypothetical protein